MLRTRFNRTPDPVLMGRLTIILITY